MRSLLRLAFLASALLFTACAAEPDSDVGPGGLDPIHGTIVGNCSPDTLESPNYEHVQLPAGFSVADDDHRAPPPIVNDAEGHGAAVGAENEAIAVEAAGDVCECTTAECVTTWIEQRIGCNVCAHMVCDEGMVGGCVPCADTGDAESDAAPLANRPGAETACIDPDSFISNVDAADGTIPARTE